MYYVRKRISVAWEVFAALKRLSAVHLSWGFGLLYSRLRLEGYTWSRRCVYGHYKRLGLHLRRAIKPKRVKRMPTKRMAASRANEGWSLDFISDRVAVGQVRMLNVIDDYSRKCLWIKAQSSYRARSLVGDLKYLVALYGKPNYIRCDNGPELISGEMADFCKQAGIELRFIQAGKPTQNALVERLNGTLRRECLNLHTFSTITHLQTCLDAWWNVYNFERPHSSLRGQTPQSVFEKNEKLYLKTVA